MSIALLTIPEVSATLQNLRRWLSRSMSPDQARRSRLQNMNGDIASHAMADHVRHKRAERKNAAQIPNARPLRIVRVLEANHSPANVGRMFMSGRMADVCAELDRLAAREAACH